MYVYILPSNAKTLQVLCYLQSFCIKCKNSAGTFGFCVLFLFCFELMFCASPVLLNLTVIKCRLGLIE